MNDVLLFKCLVPGPNFETELQRQV